MEVKATTIIKLKMEDSSSDLDVIANLCRKARNAASMNWLMRQHGFPETDKQSKRLKFHKAKNGKVTTGGKTESTKLYHAIRSAVPELGSSICSSLSQSLDSYLKAKVDWRRGDDNDGNRPRRKDAILAYEDRPPFFTAVQIPIINLKTSLTFGDTLTMVSQNISKDCPVISCSFSLKGMPPKYKILLREIHSKKRRLADSIFVRKDETWYWYISIEFTHEIRSDVEAILTPVFPSGKEIGQSDRPFCLQIPKRRPWYIGDGRYLKSQTQRLVGLRKQIGWRYRQGNGAGHGRRKIDDAVSKRRTQERNMRDEVRNRMISDVVKQCVRSECGILIYRQPTGPARRLSWFAENKLDWDWTKFLMDLTNAAAYKRIKVIHKKHGIGIEEVLENLKILPKEGMEKIV